MPGTDRRVGHPAPGRLITPLRPSAAPDRAVGYRVTITARTADPQPERD